MTRRVGYRSQVLLQPRAHHLVPLGQHQRLAKAGCVLIDVEPRAKGGDLEEDTTGLAEVDRPEVGAVDDRSRLHFGAGEGLAPGLVVLVRRRPGHVVHAAGTLDRADARRWIDMVGGAAAGGAVLEDPTLATEAQGALKQLGRVLGPGGIGPDARETEKGVLIRDAFSVGPQGRGACRVSDKLEAESLGGGEA